MHLLRKYLLSSVARAPEGDVVVAEAPEVVVPAPNALESAPAGDPPADLPTPEPEGDPPPEPAPAAHGNKGKQPWFLERISQESAARRQAEERAANAEALAARLQGGAQGDPPAAPTSSAPDFETAVSVEANRRDMMRQCDTVASAGYSKFTDWGEKTNILAAVNAATPEFVADVVAIEPTRAHELLYELANDPERAARLVAMDPRRRAAELTRMSMTAAAPAVVEPKTEAPKPAPKAASRAPAPPPPVTPSASKVVDWRSDEASEAEFDVGFKEMMAKRVARR